jgi:hypothetical protein
VELEIQQVEAALDARPGMKAGRLRGLRASIEAALRSQPATVSLRVYLEDQRRRYESSEQPSHVVAHVFALIDGALERMQPASKETRVAHSKSEYKRLKTMGADVLPPTHAPDTKTLAELDAERTALERTWQPIETAPKGSWPDGPNDTRHPDYVKPPRLWLCLKDGESCVGYFDAYYAEGGNGYDGGSPWVEKFSGERVTPTYWMPLHAGPQARQEQE